MLEFEICLASASGLILVSPFLSVQELIREPRPSCRFGVPGRPLISIKNDIKWRKSRNYLIAAFYQIWYNIWYNMIVPYCSNPHLGSLGWFLMTIARVWMSFNPVLTLQGQDWKPGRFLWGFLRGEGELNGEDLKRCHSIGFRLIESYRGVGFEREDYESKI